MIISVDFDGTIVRNRYPEIGPIEFYAKETIREWIEEGHQVIINTCRAGLYLQAAAEFLKSNGIPYSSINENLQSRIEEYGSDTRKISADLYIDDKNIFCRRIDWLEIRDEVKRITSKSTSILEREMYHLRHIGEACCEAGEAFGSCDECCELNVYCKSIENHWSLEGAYYQALNRLKNGRINK